MNEIYPHYCNAQFRLGFFLSQQFSLLSYTNLFGVVKRLLFGARKIIATITKKFIGYICKSPSCDVPFVVMYIYCVLYMSPHEHVSPISRLLLLRSLRLLHVYLLLVYNSFPCARISLHTMRIIFSYVILLSIMCDSLFYLPLLV